MTTATIEDLRMGIADLAGVEPKSISTDREANEAASWIDLEKRTEAEAEAVLGPAIKSAYDAHRRLTGEKKSLLEKLLSAKDRVRAGLANWIAAGHSVPGCHTKTKYRITVNSLEMLPPEFRMIAADMPQIEHWVDMTGGQQPIPGCTIEVIHVLYAKEVA